LCGHLRLSLLSSISPENLSAVVVLPNLDQRHRLPKLLSHKFGCVHDGKRGVYALVRPAELVAIYKDR
jgi:hypothetical protein